MKATIQMKGLLGKLCLTSAIVLVAGTAAMAQIITPTEPPLLDEGRIIIAGSACNASDSFSQISGPEGTVLSLNFNNFIISGGAARGNCTLRIPVTIPAGHRMIVTEGSPNGYAELDSGDRLSIASRLAIFANGSPVSTKTLTGPLYADFGPAADTTIPESIFRSPRRISSPCVSQDQRGFLGLNLAVSLVSPSRMAAAYVSDAQIGVRVVRCQ